MQTNHPSRATSSAEYALIVGSGVGAAASLAVQQLAIASLPVTMLVAMGLLNRYRLDSQVEQHLAEDGNSEITLSETNTPTPRPIAAPRPDAGQHSPFFGSTHSGFASNLANAGLEALQEAQQKALTSIGQILHQTRSEQQLSLEGVYMQTFIQMHQLRAMEAGNLDDLPQPFYVQRLIQKYAQHLGLDAKAIAASFPI
ncbi:MAG: helix-turn-helix domain-containing protein [Leptolyngbyaceae cyanobacterium]